MIRNDAKYRMLAKSLGVKLTQERMAFLERHHYTADLGRGDPSKVTQVANELEEYRSFFGGKKRGSKGVGRHTVHRAKTERNSTSAWEETVSVYLALQAKRSRDVQDFREAALEGGMLPAEHVEQWLQQKYQEQGLPGVWLTNIPLSKDEYLSLLGAPAIATHAHQDGDLQVAKVTLSVELPFLDLLGSANPHVLRCRVPSHRDKAAFRYYRFNYRVLDTFTTMGSALEELRTISVRLAAFYGWDEAEAAFFVLTDRPPSVQRAAIRKHVDPSVLSRARVMLTIDPTMAVEEVAMYYRRVQGQVLGSRHRELSIKHIELAKWAVERPLHKNWLTSMRDWNRAHPPNWAYRHYRNFARDCGRARDRLLRPAIHTPQEEAGASEWLMMPNGYLPLNTMAEVIAMREALMMARQGGNEDGNIR